MNSEAEVRAEAEAHWEYTDKIIQDMLRLVHTVYVEVFIHGIKHGRKDMLADIQEFLLDYKKGKKDVEK